MLTYPLFIPKGYLGLLRLTAAVCARGSVVYLVGEIQKFQEFQGTPKFLKFMKFLTIQNLETVTYLVGEKNVRR